MIKKHIITIAGTLGSGKSSTAKKIAEILNYKHYSTGDFMRKIANKRGISLGDLSKIAENDKSIDTALDNYNKEISKKENTILDSRLGFYFIPDSFKVFLHLNARVAAKRILKDKKVNINRLTEATGNFNTIESIVKNTEKRLSSERKRYKSLYNIDDQTSLDNFDLVIDTEKILLNEVVETIIEKYKKWLKN